VVKQKVVLTYDDVPQRDFLDLSGSVNFPNLQVPRPGKGLRTGSGERGGSGEGGHCIACMHLNMSAHHAAG
jgi:hypothetical protein